MLQHIKQVLMLFICLAALSCKSENDLVPIKDDLNSMSEGNSSTERPKLDVLLVLDNSCSMIEDWDYITYGLTQTPIELDHYGFDWKMAMISMDPSDAIFVEVGHTTNPSDAGWQMIGLLSDFRLVAGEDEKAFSSAITARTRYASWFRELATTLIVFISDEKEQSGIDPADFHSLWNYPHFVASIVGPESIPEGTTSCAEEAKDFHDASDIIVDICTNQPWSVIEPLTH